MLVASTAFLMLADGAKQARPAGCTSIYLSNLCLIVIFFKVEYLGAHLHILFLSSGDMFCIAVAMLYITILANR